MLLLSLPTGIHRQNIYRRYLWNAKTRSAAYIRFYHPPPGPGAHPLMLHSLFLIGSFGTTEILLIVFMIVLLFGAKRIPELLRGMGQGVREFKDASTKPEEQQPQYRDQPGQPQPPYQQQYPSQQPGHGQPQQPNYNQQPGYNQPQQTGYQQPTPPAYNPNDPTNQPR